MTDGPQPSSRAIGTEVALGLNDKYFRRYLEIAPTALALERSIECELLARQEWHRPVLDVGCGDGNFARVLFREKLDTGIDLDPVEVERARICDAYRELIVCPGDRIPKPDASYKTVLSNSVLEHIPNLAAVLVEVNRLLVRNGMFYITVPTDRLEHASFPAQLLSGIGFKSLAARYGRFYCRFWRHYHAYDEHEWRRMLGVAGFDVVEERSYIPTNLSTFYDLLVPVAFPSFLFKRVLGRWVLWPPLRRVTSGLICASLVPIITSLNRGNGSCLVFYA